MKNKIKFIILFAVLFIFCLAMYVMANENLNLKKVESTYNGSIIEVSADKKISTLWLYKLENNGQYSRFYIDNEVNASSKKYFISKYRLSTEDTSKLKAVAVLEDGTSISSEIEIDKIPASPQPSTSPTQTTSPSTTATGTPSPSVSSTPSVTVSPSPSSTANSKEETLTLNKSSLKLALNDNKTAQLKATLKNAKSGTKLTWSTDNNKVAKVASDGKVTAVGTGTTTISVKTVSGTKASCKVNVTASTGKIEVLFVGNSKTYVSNIPDKFKKLSAKGGYTISVSTATKGGKTLKYLSTKSNNSTDKLTGKNNYSTITGKAYDYVIMQEQSDTYAKNYSTFLTGASNIKKLVSNKNKNVKLFVRQCWVYKSSSSSSKNNGYNNAKKVASKIGASLIFDGKAMYKAVSSTSINMFVDNTHQSSAGAYLSACCIYSAVFDKSPVNLKYYGDLSETKAKKLKMIAWSIYSSNK